MSRNGSGTYNLPAGNPVVTGTTITTTWANTTLNDIGSALTGSVASDGQTPMSGSLNMANNKVISVTDPTNAQDAATKAYVDLVAGGTKDGSFVNLAYTGTLTGGTGIVNLGSGQVYKDASGNVGIGTSSPTARLTVADSAAPKLNFSVGASTERAFISYTESTALMRIDSDASIVFASNNTEAARIDTSGNLLVGITTSVDGKVQIKTTTANWGVAIDSTNATTQYFERFTYNGTQIGYITGNNTNVTYSTSSDYRLKENIAPMTGALDTVAKLKPVTYKWKFDGSNGQGFIAHELQEVVPDCVTGEKDATRIEKYEISPAIPAEVDEDGKVIKEAVEAVMSEREVPAYQGIDTSFLVATLTAAIQEQQAMIEELKTKVLALEAK